MYDSDGKLTLRKRRPEPEEREMLFELGKKIANESDMTCKEGYKLNYRDMKSISRIIFGYRNGFVCNICEKGYNITDRPIYCMHCSLCFYDVCMKCATKKIMKTYSSKFNPYKLCENA